MYTCHCNKDIYLVTYILTIGMGWWKEEWYARHLSKAIWISWLVCVMLLPPFLLNHYKPFPYQINVRMRHHARSVSMLIHAWSNTDHLTSFFSVLMCLFRIFTRNKLHGHNVWSWTSVWLFSFKLGVNKADDKHHIWTRKDNGKQRQ